MSTGMLVAIEMVLIIGGVLVFAIHQLVSVRRSLARDRESQRQLQAGSVPNSSTAATAATAAAAASPRSPKRDPEGRR